MAGSRTEKYGTVFTRVAGLIKSGAMKHRDRPVWHDVWAAFPPRVDPVLERDMPQRQPRKIIYREDFIRVRFRQIYGAPSVADLRRHSSNTLQEKFVSHYLDIESKNKELDEDSIFAKAVELMQNEGFILRSSQDIQQAQEKLESLYAESKEEGDDGQMLKPNKVTGSDFDPINVSQLFASAKQADYSGAEKADSQDDMFDDTKETKAKNDKDPTS